jgi:hypothetical protein
MSLEKQPLNSSWSASHHVTSKGTHRPHFRSVLILILLILHTKPNYSSSMCDRSFPFLIPDFRLFQVIAHL